MYLALLPISKPPTHPSVGVGKIGLSLLVIIVPVVAGIIGLRMVGSGKQQDGGKGGTGKVVGVVGRMGSGKSYFAVRMAYRRLMAGAHVCSNFSMHFEHLCETAACEHVDVDTCIAAQLRSRWSRFVGWEQMIELEDCVVIVDEAHLYAPSNKAITFPDDARWKLSMARKYRLDIYWITQHEARVNSVLKDLTNMMYVCSSWFGAKWFTAKGYEPEKMRRKDQHIDRRMYRLNLTIARLYDTLEILEVDGVHVGKGTKINELAQARNAGRQAAATAAKVARCEHEAKNHKPAGSCPKCRKARTAAAVADREAERDRELLAAERAAMEAERAAELAPDASAAATAAVEAAVTPVAARTADIAPTGAPPGQRRLKRLLRPPVA